MLKIGARQRCETLLTPLGPRHQVCFRTFMLLQRRLEGGWLPVGPEVPDGPGGFEHSRGGIQRNAICVSRQRLTLRNTCRTTA